MSKKPGYSPMMTQFLAVKEQYPDVLLLYRMGDFYETFFEDAKIAARELELTLTSRDGGKDGERIPMAGVPHHALDNYLPKLIARGFRVAICEQMEDPALAKGLVRREVVRVVTPGTVLEASMLREKQNNFLAAVVKGAKGFGLAYCDASTGEFAVTELPDAPRTRHELDRLGVAECILPLDAARLGWIPAPDKRLAPADLGAEWLDALPEEIHVTPRPPASFELEPARRALHEQFQVASLEGFGCAAMPLAIRAAGAIVGYLRETQKAQLPLFARLRTYQDARCLVLDAATRKHLELTATSRDGSYKGSLLALLDRTNTAMGGRKLRSWLLAPLVDGLAIADRHDAVEELVAEPGLLRALGARLGGVRDIERLAGRVAAGTANGRDLVALRDSLLLLPHIAALVAHRRPVLLAALHPAPGELVALAGDIADTLVDAPPISVTEGGVIREGWSPEVDDLRALLGDSQAWLAAFEAAEKARTGIKSLKVGFTKAFGYYIEVTHANRHLVPAAYHRKQTLVNCERFITPELKERETAILQGEDRLHALEYELFTKLRDRAAVLVPALQEVGGRLAELDALTALAEVAVERGWVRPAIADDTRLEVEDGRHPVIEALLPAGSFVPNDALLDTDTNQLLVLTGPNMAGKSTFMRQLAHIVVLAQMGSFVPAAQAHVGLVDRIFTRIGAVDDLATGQSTFMVEMNETANILNHATERSLIVLDEIGRGTSTLDGLSIAWAVCEHLAQEVRARTIFATHYHELTGLALHHPGVRNYRVLVEETADEVIFLHRVVPGGADRSYGIEVARLAGLPAKVVDRAKQVLTALEKNNKLAASLKKTLASDELAPSQLPLFEASRG